MKIPTVMEVLAGDSAVFDRLDHTSPGDAVLWYMVNIGNGTGYTKLFMFPVPLRETEGGTFLSHDKTIFFMRWIRRHIEFLRAAQVSE